MKMANLIIIQIIVSAVSVIGINIISSDMNKADTPSNAVLVNCIFYDNTEGI